MAAGLYPPTATTPRGSPVPGPRLDGSRGLWARARVHSGSEQPEANYSGVRKLCHPDEGGISSFLCVRTRCHEIPRKLGMIHSTSGVLIPGERDAEDRAQRLLVRRFVQKLPLCADTLGRRDQAPLANRDPAGWGQLGANSSPREMGVG